MSIVHVMRHGQVYNPGRVLYERLPDFHLSDLGRDMASKASRWYEGHPITHLRCSPLERAQETMEPVHALFPDLEVVTDARVIEAGNELRGQVMGHTAQAARDPKNWHLFLHPLRPSWGEAYADMAMRMNAALRDAADAAGDGEAIIVSHQLPIWITRLSANGRHLWHDPRKRQCTLCSITTFHLYDGAVARIEYAEPAGDLLPNAPHYGF
ncbi:MAG: histidine phosphatase family protein [Propionibacteriaceae bacterium]|jgi:broad specificity phosphatase PhoE|nr:histidine phosphatase family protein [Propionibacteriaceae bacterium]